MLCDSRGAPLRRYASTSLGGTFRLHRDQLLYGVDLAVNEGNVRDLDPCPALVFVVIGYHIGNLIADKGAGSLSTLGRKVADG